MVEHSTADREVAGSSPAVPWLFFCHNKSCSEYGLFSPLRKIFAPSPLFFCTRGARNGGDAMSPLFRARHCAFFCFGEERPPQRSRCGKSWLLADRLESWVGTPMTLRCMPGCGKVLGCSQSFGARLLCNRGSTKDVAMRVSPGAMSSQKRRRTVQNPQGVSLSQGAQRCAKPVVCFSWPVDPRKRIFFQKHFFFGF